MQDFIEKWNKDSRFKTKTKLILYTLFVVLVAIFATSNRTVQNIEENDTLLNEENGQIENNNNINETNKIELPSEYNYQIEILVNDEKYNYSGRKQKNKELITKEINNVKTNYMYQANKYYKEEDPNLYVLTTKEDIYDSVEETYININTINEYLSKSQKEDDKYIVYLKNIILGNDSEEYITITKEPNKINIDYTNLIKYFNKTIDKYIVNIEIE